MYKVYTNRMIRKICDLKVAICLTNRFCSTSTFADDMTHLAQMLLLYQFSLGVPMIIVASGGANIITRKVEL